MGNTLQNKIDEKSIKFLRAIEYYGGEATKSEIRARTGLNHNETSYRFKKLEDLELIDVTKASVGKGERNPRVAHLTGTARREIERGLFSDVETADEDEDSGQVEISEEEFMEMQNELQELRQRVNVLTQARSGGGDGDVDDEVRERVERLEQRVADVQAKGAGGDGVTPRQVAEAPAVKTIEKRLGELEEDVGGLESYIYEWNEAAETYMRALRRAVEDKLGVSLQSYFETKEDSPGDVSEAR